MDLNSKDNWLRRSMVCAILSAVSLSFLSRAEAFYWAPGVFFAVLVVTARSKKPELLMAVVLSYTLGYASSELLEKLGVWPMRIGVVMVGSGLLALSLRWKGGLSSQRANKLFMLGTVLALPFWLFIDRAGGGEPPLAIWIAAFSSWQMPMAWYYLKES